MGEEKLTKNELEIFGLLRLPSADVRWEAAKIIGGLTATEGGHRILAKSKFYGAKSIRDLIVDEKTSLDLRDMLLDSLINTTYSSGEVSEFLTADESFLKFLCAESQTSVKSSMLLSNLTRTFGGCEALVSAVANFYGDVLPKFFAQLHTDNEIGDFHSYILRNCSQLRTFRDVLLSSSEENKQQPALIHRLLPLTHRMLVSSKRREAVVDILRNCCFDHENHPILISLGDFLICSLLLPLAGPEEFDEEDNEKLPLDLQYLEPDKQRETECIIRLKLLETLYQLCATKEGREFMRNSGVYLILREYHKWETNEDADDLCHNVVNVLIRTEEEIGADNLHLLDTNSLNERKI